MDKSSSPPTDSLPFDNARHIDQVCDQFESAWREGQQPRLEDYLVDSPEPVRTVLLRELLALDLAYRRRKAEVPTLEEYRQRFPAHDPLLREFFRDQTPADLVSDRPAPSSPIDDAPKTSDDHVAGPRTGAYREGKSADALTLPSPAAAADVTAGMVLGDYELLEKLGAGGMGLVFRARQRRANRIVALKVIRPELMEGLTTERYRQWLARFQREAEFAARLEHAAIVAVYEVGTCDGRPFFSMRYVAGQSLAQMVRAGPLPDRRAAAYLEGVARAVAHAHGRGVLHRDLKPANILVDADDQPFVSDFGLAKGLEGSASLTDTGACLGSPPFMSPEQVEDSSRVTAASDIYSLGATLYNVLTGRPPFQAARPAETLNQVLTRDPVPPRQLNPAIARDLETITLKCLRKEPGRRYATAGDLADDLSRFLKGEPIRARPVGSGERLLRWTRRNPLVASLAAGVVILFLGFWAATLIGYWKVGLAQREVTRQQAEALESQRSALVEQATAHGLAREGGHRWAALDALRRAAAIRPGSDLRDRYLQYLDLSDLRLVEDRGLAGELPAGSGSWPLIAPGDWPRSGLLGEVVQGSGPGCFRLITSTGPVEIDPRGLHAAVKLAGIEEVRDPAVLSPNGRFFAATLAEADGSRVWDLNTGKVLGALTDETGRKSVPHLLAFNAPSDRLVVGFQSAQVPPTFSIRTFRLGERGLEALKTWTLRAEGLDCLHIAPSGDLLAAGMTAPRGPRADCYGIWRWNEATAPPKEPLRLDDAGGWNQTWRTPNRIATSPDGRFLVAARDHLRLWDLAAVPPRELWAQSLTPRQASRVFLSADGHWIITGEATGQLTLWDAFAEGRLILRTRTTPAPTVPGIDWTGADAASLVVDERPDDGRPPGARVWQLARPLSRDIQPPQPLIEPSRGPEQLALAFSPDERWLAYAYAAHLKDAPYLVDLHQPAAPPQPLRGGAANPRLLAFSPAGDQLWSVSDQEQVTWHLPDRHATRTARQDPVIATAISARGQVLGALKAKVRLTAIDLTTGRELWSSPTTPGNAEFVAPPQFSPDGRQLLTATRTLATPSVPSVVRTQLWDCDRRTQITIPLLQTGHFFFRGGVPMALTDAQTLALKDLNTNKDLPVVPRDLPPAFRNRPYFGRFTFSDDGRLCADDAEDGSIGIWEFHGPERKLRTILKRQTGSFTVADLMAFSQDGTRLVAFDSGKFLKVWDTRTGNVLGRLELKARPESFTFAGKGGTVLLVYLGGQVLSWRPGDNSAHQLCRLQSDPALDREKSSGWWQGALLPIVDAVRISADRRRLVYVARADARQTYTVYLWSLPEGRLTTRSVPAQGRGWPRLGLSGDGSKLAILESWAEVELAWVQNPAVRISLDRTDWALIENRDALRSRLMQLLHVSPDGSYGAYVEEQPTGPRARVVRLADQASVWTEDLSEPVIGLALAAEGRALAVGHPAGRVSLYHPLAPTRALRLEGIGGSVESLAFDQSATLLATASAEGTITLWNAQTGAKLVRLATGFEGVNRIALSPRGRWLAVVGGKGQLRLWDLQTVRTQLREAGLDWK